MRLIDADKIVFTNCLVKSGLRVCCHNEGIVPKESIEMQPTVKAIPVEWIVKWLKKDNKHYCSVDLMLEEWEEEQARLFEKQITEECTSAERFAGWEKENEQAN